MKYTTCNHCIEDSKTCPVRKEFERKLREVGLTSGRFRCDRKWQRLQPGTVVKIEFKILEYDGPEDVGEHLVEHEAVVMRTSRNYGKLVVWVHDPDGLREARHRDPQGKAQERHVYAVWPDRCKPTGATVEMCRDCGAPQGAHDSDELGDWYCQDVPCQDVPFE